MLNFQPPVRGVDGLRLYYGLDNRWDSAKRFVRDLLALPFDTRMRYLTYAHQGDYDKIPEPYRGVLGAYYVGFGVPSEQYYPQFAMGEPLGSAPTVGSASDPTQPPDNRSNTHWTFWDRVWTIPYAIGKVLATGANAIFLDYIPLIARLGGEALRKDLSWGQWWQKVKDEFRNQTALTTIHTAQDLERTMDFLNNSTAWEKVVGTLQMIERGLFNSAIWYGGTALALYQQLGIAPVFDEEGYRQHGIWGAFRLNNPNRLARWWEEYRRVLSNEDFQAGAGGIGSALYLWEWVVGNENPNKKITFDYVKVRVYEPNGSSYIEETTLQEAGKFEWMKQKGMISDFEVLERRSALTKVPLFGTDINYGWLGVGVAGAVFDPTNFGKVNRIFNLATIPKNLAILGAKGASGYAKFQAGAEIVGGLQMLPFSLPFTVGAKAISLPLNTAPVRYGTKFLKELGVQAMEHPVATSLLKNADAFVVQPLNKMGNWMASNFFSGYYTSDDLLVKGGNFKAVKGWLRFADDALREVKKNKTLPDGMLLDAERGLQKLASETGAKGLTEAEASAVSKFLKSVGVQTTKDEVMDLAKSLPTRAVPDNLSGLYKSLQETIAEYGVEVPSVVRKIATTRTQFGIGKTLTRTWINTHYALHRLGNRFPFVGALTSILDSSAHRQYQIGRQVIRFRNALLDEQRNMLASLALAFTGDPKYEQSLASNLLRRLEYASEHFRSSVGESRTIELTKNLAGLPELRRLKGENLVDYSVRRTLEEIYERTGITLGNSPEEFANFRAVLKHMKAVQTGNVKAYGIPRPVIEKAYGLTREQADKAFTRLNEIVRDPVLSRLFNVAYDVLVENPVMGDMPHPFVVALSDILRTGYTPSKLESVRSIYENMQTLVANLKPQEREVFREKLGMILGDIANRVILRPDELRGRLDELFNLQSVRENIGLRKALEDAVGQYFGNVRNAEAMALNVALRKQAIRDWEQLYRLKKEQYEILKKAKSQIDGNKPVPDCV